MTQILYITSAGSHWGSEESLFSLIRNIPQCRYEPFVLTVQGPFQQKLKQFGIHHAVFQSYTLSKKECLPFILLIWRISKFILRNKFSLIHSNDIHSAQYSILAARLSKIPAVIHVRSPGLPSWLLCKNRIIIQLAEKIIAISENVKKELIEIGIPEKNITVISNAVDTSVFNKQMSGMMFREEMGISDDTPLIGIVGRIIPIKGQEVFIRAAAIISRIFPNALFVIVGEEPEADGTYVRQLKDLAKKLGIRHQIRFSGFRADIPFIMDALDILVTPSEKEAFGRVIIEAMAMNTAVVAANIGGIPEIIRHGINGFLAAPKNAEEIAAKVIRLLSDRHLYESFCEQGRKTVQERYTISVQVEKISCLYDSLLNKDNCRNLKRMN